MRTKYYLTIILYTYLLSPTLGQSLAKFVPVLNGFNEPTDIAAPDDLSNRLFVVEKRGVIKIVQNEEIIGEFLDLSNKVSTNSERGLLGLAFHPSFESNGIFYVNYTDRGNNFNTIIAKFTVSDSDPNRADPESEKLVMTIPQPFNNHNGGDMSFGPDGYLYIGLGDGGSGGDPQNNAQNLNSLLGKMLRIDVDNPIDGMNYGIPEDNPFINNPNARDEIWAFGLRNPWRFSFDQLTGDMWIGDVGQGDQEEISVIPAGAGGLNFGWRCFEGDLSYSNCANIDHTLPVYTYSRPDEPECSEIKFCGKSVTGGMVYRGENLSVLQGKYFFADYVSSRIWTYDLESGLIEEVNGDNRIARISTFGETHIGEIYVASLNGDLYKLEVSQTTSKVQSDSQINIELAPNPVRNNLQITMNTMKRLQIVDVSGRLMRDQNVTGMESFSVNLTDFSPGTYFIKLFNDDKLFYRKFVKQ